MPSNAFDRSEHHEASLTPAPEMTAPEFGQYLGGRSALAGPVVLRGYHSQDRALHTWSFRDLLDRLPDQTVDLDVGDAMVSDGLTFSVESLHDYLRELDAGTVTTDASVRYLQGFNIFAADPSLADDIHFPHLHQVARREVRAGWIGPAGTVTGYHADIGDNQLSQVVGTKLVKLVSPDQSERVYRTKKYDPNGVACAVDADNWDQVRHPRFAETEALYVVLEPGDSVFIPGGWYHYVRSLSPSISVNQLGYTARQLLVGKTADQFRRFLHNRGLYGESCTCHMMVDGERVARR